MHYIQHDTVGRRVSPPSLFFPVELSERGCKSNPVTSLDFVPGQPKSRQGLGITTTSRVLRSLMRFLL